MFEEKEIIRLFEIEADGCIKNINLSVCKGESLGIVGKTASGKSCVADIISGVREQTAGEIFFCGERTDKDRLRSLAARADKTDRIISELSAAENIFLGDIARFGKVLTVDEEKLTCECRAALHRVGLSYIHPDEKATGLNYGECRLLELARLLCKQPKIIVLDEFLSSVSRTWRQRILRVLDRYKQHGGAVVYVTRDIDLAMNTCDSIAFMENGKITRVARALEFADKETQFDWVRHGEVSCDILLRATNLCDERLNNIGFKLFGGEVLGVLGTMTSGIHRLGRVLFGDIPLERGRITVGGHGIKSVKGAICRKMAYAHESFGYERILEILELDRDIFILDSVLSGIGDDKRLSIKHKIDGICRRGGAVIYISEDADEILSLCDRILVLTCGEITGEFLQESCEKRKIIELMIK